MNRRYFIQATCVAIVSVIVLPSCSDKATLKITKAGIIEGGDILIGIGGIGTLSSNPKIKITSIVLKSIGELIQIDVVAETLEGVINKLSTSIPAVDLKKGQNLQVYIGVESEAPIGLESVTPLSRTASGRIAIGGPHLKIDSNSLTIIYSQMVPIK